MVIGLICGKTSSWKGQCYETVFANCHGIRAKLNIEQRHGVGARKRRAFPQCTAEQERSWVRNPVYTLRPSYAGLSYHGVYST